MYEITDIHVDLVIHLFFPSFLHFFLKETKTNKRDITKARQDRGK